MPWNDILLLAAWSLGWATVGAAIGHLRGQHVEARRWASYAEVKIDPQLPHRRGAVTRCFQGHWYWVSRDDRDCPRCMVKNPPVSGGEMMH